MKRLSLKVNKRNSSTSPFYIDTRQDGKRRRQFFETRSAAEDALRKVKTKIRREGDRALTLPDDLRIAALTIQEQLEPFGKTLRDAGAHYLQFLRDTNRSITVAGLIAEYLTSRERIKCSVEHMRDLRYRYGAFDERFGTEPIRALTADAIEHWLDELELSPVSINNFRSRLSSLFVYGIKKRYVDRNPIKDIEKVKVPDLPPAILSVDDLQRLLAAAPSDLLPVLAISSFAGVRTHECVRLDWSQINLVRGYIEIQATKAKTARRRLIKIQPNLVAWLTTAPTRIGPIWPYAGDLEERVNAFQRARKRLVKASGVAWPKNSSRHSFCSYHLAAYNDENLLRNDMGHANSNLIFSVYRELVHPEEGERYFALFPPTPAENVIAMTA